MPSISGPIRPGSLAPRRPANCLYKRVGGWAVRESGPSWTIRLLTWGPRSPAIVVYKLTAQPGICIAILVDSRGGNLPMLLARPQSWVKDTWQVSNLACQSCERYGELKYPAFLGYLGTCALVVGLVTWCP